ncbi:MAG TPA: right-handed parallel beta-helix repeat-containing protein, partial [Cyclobacteriaceae bacterium]|nr:right-handed parallel beta-helix repeat-containing protein [Cyclobacteriaceae bacterium]
MRLITLLLLISQCNVNAANYYLSQKGNDNNTGTSKDTPWRSLKKLNELIHTTHFGDSIFFERGSVFKGQLEISSSGLYLGAYGSGTKPVIGGSLKLNTWILFTNNIWKTECSDCAAELNNLFIDGKVQPLGRYPNEGYLPISGYLANQNSILDESSKFVDDHWSNAEIVVRSSRWTIDKLRISEYRNKTFYTDDKPSYKLQPGFGYFIQKHLSTLDQHGEWFYDSKAKLIYIYFKTGFIPSKYVIEASNAEVGLDAKNANDITIENIIFIKQNSAGVRLMNCDNARLNKIEIINSGKNGLEITSCENPNIENSRIIASNNNGMDWSNSSGGKLVHNNIERTGLLAGRGESGNGTYIAIYITSSGKFLNESIIEENTIDSTGYSGIDFRTSRTQIRNNHISNFCLTKDDGAGVYTWNNIDGDNIIEGNTIKNGIGSDKGTANKGELYVSGIYIDDNSSQVSIKNNEVSNCSMAGIFIHNSNNIKLFKNNLFANGNYVGNREKGQLYIKTDNIVKRNEEVSLNIEAIQNNLTATSETSYCLFLSSESKDGHLQIGLFKQNQFNAINSNLAIAESDDQIDRCFAPEVFNLNSWQLSSQNEKESTFKYWPSKEKLGIKSYDLITKGKLISEVDDWMSWPEESFIEKGSDGRLPGRTLKINIPNKIKEALFYHTKIYLNENKLYRLTFSAKSTKSNKIEFAPLMANSPWAAIGK